MNTKIRQNIKRAAIACQVYSPLRRIYRRLLNHEGLRRLRREMAFYTSFVSPGDLCFDVGSNIGAKTEVLLAIGARVVAFEPQPDCFREMSARCRNRRLSAINAAVGAAPGELPMYIQGNRAVSSLKPDWSHGAKSVLRVPVITLDQAIDLHGLPVFCKIDVEGFEMEVLKGLSHPLPYLSLEYHLDPDDIQKTLSCIEYLSRFGELSMNITRGEEMEFAWPNWVDYAAFRDHFPARAPGRSTARTATSSYARGCDRSRPARWPALRDRLRRPRSASAHQPRILEQAYGIEGRIEVCPRPSGLRVPSPARGREQPGPGSLPRHAGAGEVRAEPGGLRRGANVGQSVEQFRKQFDRPTIHCFEPGPETFEQLRKRTAGVPDLHLNNAALGSRIESRIFVENQCPDMSSFLEPSTDGWGSIKGRRPVEVWTLDDYCDRMGVDRVDILKSDTQGYDLEVFRGAEAMIRRRAIHLIYTEIIFSDMYKGLPRLDEIYGFLADRGFALVSFYTFFFQNERASWTDALFVHPGFGGGMEASPGAARG